MDVRARNNPRDVLFTAIFYRVTLTYARTVPQSARRIIEFMLLVKAVSLLLVLIYIHGIFSKQPTNCLSDIEDTWPRDGILRVEIISNASKDYNLAQSYKKQYGPINYRYLHDDMDIPSSNETDNTNQTIDIENTTGYNYSAIPGMDPKNESEENEENSTTILEEEKEKEDEQNESSFSFLTGSTAEFELLAQAVWPEERYIVEYSLEHGFLRLSPKTRKKLNITVMLKVLDPDADDCFGDWFSRLIMDEFLGYDDILMSSIKVLAEKDNSKGYLRNVVTNEHYRFVSKMWMERSSYVPALFWMLSLTLLISMLLRFSHHQTQMFVVYVFNAIETNTALAIPVAPILTVVFALVGIEGVLSEYFEDTVTSFYVIIIVALADKFDAICCHTRISKRYWLRFFFLYHYVFYAYHYRFHGQYSLLALVTSWLFIQHSMLYFFHHYEIPAVVRQDTIYHLAATVNIHNHQRAPGRRADQPDPPTGSTSVSETSSETVQTSSPNTLSETSQVNGNVSEGATEQIRTEYTPSLTTESSAESDLTSDDESLLRNTEGSPLSQSTQSDGPRLRNTANYNGDNTGTEES